MKQRFLNVLKWFFIILGILFLFQILITIGMFIGFNKFTKADLGVVSKSSKNISQIQPVIDYVENYKKENGKYPIKLENIKVKKGLNFKYETSNNQNCYSITFDISKEKVTRQYQYCAMSSDNSNSTSESYIEFSN